MATVDQAIVSKASEIRQLPYARFIVSEDVIERNFGYKIIRQQVAMGRNSVVYKCETAKHQGIYCLIKTYKPGKDGIKSLLHEETCQIMRFVTGKCPQVISTVDLFYTSEKLYLMCDWSAKGEVLNNMRQRSVRLNEAMLHDWTVDMLSAVNFLHSNGICHRNIAPNCLLLTQENRVKIGTLGDAVIYCKPDGSLIKQKWANFSRSANWNQPPEVAKGKPYDPRRADIWSIGATVYWFITKAHPLNYNSSSKLTKQLEHNLNIMHKVSTKCQTFVKRVLTYQPPSRPSLASVMQLDWVVGGAGAKTSPQPRDSIEIGVAENREADPGEATGPDGGQLDEPMGQKRETSAKRETSQPRSPSAPEPQATEETPPPAE